MANGNAYSLGGNKMAISTKMRSGTSDPAMSDIVVASVELVEQKAAAGQS